MPIKSFYLIITLFSALFISMNSLCAPATDKPSLISGNFNGRDHNSRTKALENVEDQLSELNSFIPNPSPDEIKWVHEEQNEINKSKGSEAGISRWKMLYSTIPYQELSLKNTLKKSLLLISKIKTAKDIKTEMYYWAELSSILIQKDTFHDAILILRKKIKLPPHIEPLDSLLIEADGVGILNYILIPYLKLEAYSHD